MARYWFQRKNKRRVPITWQGWALYAFWISLVVGTMQLRPIWVVFIVAGAVSVAVTWCMDKFVAPEGQTIDASNKPSNWKAFGGIVLGMAVALLVATAVNSIYTGYIRSMAGTAVQVANDSWLEFHPDSGDFSVLLPKFPTYESKDLGIMTQRTYESDAFSDGQFVIGVADIPAGFDTSASLSNGMAGIRASFEKQSGQPPVGTSTRAIFESMDAMKYSFISTSSDQRVDGIIFYDSTEVFSLLYSQRTELFSTSTRDKFITSFKLAK